ncbi:AMP-dependent synthetase/ligase [Streptomyces radicis]|uniref:Long-chain fatty acid--CoA ligase n=1 Tax=Streptomyces radicis TaxID=1750517 RepID=A0A3A9VX76_9ACTN|nr:AMP-dependent synthetase/ligase [Streptomyces radicis]RKN05558.1 long-chain fatty acid--CoA ligase [Streptomyces radicis]RKN17427.1 long-chain fatty acid--CoA ligase [Streptomyces radicis]
MARTRTDAPAPAPRLFRPELFRENGVVTGAFVPQAAPAVTQGSLADLPFINAYEAPDQIILSRRNRDGTWRDITCAEFAAEVVAVAKGLIAHGLRPGDRLAIMSRTRYEWTLLDFAAWAAGLITVPLYPSSPAWQVSRMLRDSGARACAVEGVDEARTLSAVRHDLPGLEHLWQLTAIAGDERGPIGQISAAGRDVSDAAVTERRGLLDPWRAATLVYTPGTTGAPKGCVLTHGNLFAEVDSALEALAPVFTADENGSPPATLLFLPLAHVLGRVVAIGCLRARVRLGHAPSTRTEDLLADLAGFGPTFLFAIPHLLEKVFSSGRADAERSGRVGAFDRAARVARRFGAAEEARRHGAAAGPGLGLRAARSLYDPLVYRRIRAALGGNLRHVVSGGSPLGRRLGTFFEGAGVSVHEGYGLTETSASVTVTQPGAPRLGTVGWPLPGTEVGIADDGEVLVRGAQVFGGYWDADRRAVVPATDAEGWLATGDLGALDDEGHLTIAGRREHMITTARGLTVAPGPLEDAVRSHPLVSHCVVAGHRRPYLTALITLDRRALAHWRDTAERRRTPLDELVDDPDVLRQLQRAVDEANALDPAAEGIRRFRVMPRDLSEASGHLTPSRELRRAEVMDAFAEEFHALYAEE